MITCFKCFFLSTDEALMYYANDAIIRQLGRRELRRQVNRRAFERGEIADTQLTEQSIVPQNIFIYVVITDRMTY